MNPWERLRAPGQVKDIEEEVFTNVSRAARRVAFSRSEVYTARKREIARIRGARRIINKHIRRCEYIGRAYMEADPFYRDIVSLLFGEKQIIDNYKRVRGLNKVIDKLSEEFIGRISRSRNTKDMIRYRKRGLARLMSVIKRRSDIIDFFAKLHRFASRLPSISRENPLIIVAGPPNVGKSSLVMKISSAKPEIAEYPFTTKKISLGHLVINGQRVQIMDTPGLLDRPMAERNEIEKQAILAIKHLADVLIYMFDPSPMRYYPIEKQVNLLKEIEGIFKGLYIIRVSNKADIRDTDVTEKLSEDVIEISILTEYGLDTLMRELREVLSGMLQRPR